MPRAYSQDLRERVLTSALARLTHGAVVARFTVGGWSVLGELPGHTA